MVIQAMDTTLIHNDAHPVVYIYAQDWHQYISHQMEVKVAQSLGDEIEVKVNRAVALVLVGLRRHRTHIKVHTIRRYIDSR